MSCDNFTDYVNNVNTICGSSMPVIIENCDTYCLLNIVNLLNDCLKFLVIMELDTELENMVDFCYNKNYNIGHLNNNYLNNNYLLKIY